MIEKFRIDTWAHNHPIYCYFRQAFKKKIKNFIFLLLGIKKKNDKLLLSYQQLMEFIYSRYILSKKVLDVGCGLGHNMTNLSKKWQCKCYGLDYSKAMVEKAKRNQDNLNIFVGSSSALALKDNSVDLVIMDYLIHHLPQGVDELSLKEAMRVSKETILINDSFAPESLFLRYLAGIYWKITDGGFHYRTRKQWYTFLGKENIFHEIWGEGPWRFCILVVRVVKPKSETK